MTVLRPDPVSTTASDRGSAARRAGLLAIALLLATIGLVGPGASVASAAPRQDPGVTTTIDPTASSAPPTTAATATTAAPTTTPAATGPDTDKVAEEDRKIWLVVGGLVAVALALLLLTIRYWRQTKPVPVAAPTDATAPAAGGRRSRRAERGRHSRRAVAGADHAAADDEWEPRGTGEHERIDVPAATTSPRPNADQRAAAYAAARGR